MTALVSLSAHELSIAGYVGINRHVDALQRNRKPAYGAANGAGQLEMNVMGALAEFAVAKHFNFYWTAMAVNTTGLIDVGGCIEVRSVPKPTHCLLLHPDQIDKDHLPYVLVYSDPPRFELLGWIRGRDGKQQRFWQDPLGGRPAYFVPRSALQPIETLVFLKTLAVPA